MGLSTLPLFLSFVLLFLLHTPPSHAAKKSYVVYMGAHSHGAEPTSADLEKVTNSHYDLVASYVGSNERAKDSIFYSYKRYINGFAATLEEKEAAEIEKHPNVLSVFENQPRKLHTTRSWNFLQLEGNGGIQDNSAWKTARFGEDTIIGNLDTGVWPESKSFSDEGMGPIPSRWRGICQKGGFKDDFRCNRKLIGARYFNKGIAASAGGHLNISYYTNRDSDGHGSHTLSTAGGNFVAGASMLGNGNGTAKGGSPKARVAAYKVCWAPINDNQCFDADIMAAYEAAIGDGVDVISMSLGGNPIEYFRDAISIGSFHAVKHGIVVVSSAGNDGPLPGTVANVAPWMITVAASTIDRKFENFIALGNKKHIKGTSLSAGIPSNKFTPLISAADASFANVSAEAALLCLAKTLDPKKVKGKILVCLRGENARISKGYHALQAGAVGMILANDKNSGNDTSPDTHFLPTSHITYTDGQQVFAYINSTKSPIAFMTRVRTELAVKPSPLVASFSSRGPNLLDSGILKPDITAPGVNIIAAYSEAISITEVVFDKRRFPYDMLSGTSMACPHVSGIVSLLKTLHPKWSPAAIKSAIMTTAKTRGNNMKPILSDSSKLKATALEYGAGQVQPNSAMDPGLIYDLTVDDYLNYLCARGYNQSNIQLFSENRPHACPKFFSIHDLNYPSITIPNLHVTPVTVTRTVTNVGSPQASYLARVKQPAGVLVSVNPTKLNFKAVGEKQSFKVTLSPTKAGNLTDFVFGELVWSDGKHFVRSPITVSSSN